jgi:hypothetical protein
MSISEASLASLAMSSGLQPLGERLQLIAAAGGQHYMSAFLGERFGGRSPNALGRAGDQDALAAQMKIHGIALSVGGKGPMASSE